VTFGSFFRGLGAAARAWMNVQRWTDMRKRALVALGYDGADTGRHLAAWRPGARSADGELKQGRRLLRDRARDLERNDGWAKNAIRALTTNVAGTGFSADFDDDDPREDVWREWAESSACDHEGDYNLKALLRQIVFNRYLSGEVLIVRRRQRKAIVRRGKRLPPLRLQLLETDFIDRLKNEEKTAAGGRIIDGIELDADGRRVAYWLYDAHPGDPFSRMATTSRRVLASEVIHYFGRERAGQMSGAPALAPAITLLRDIGDSITAHLGKQKVAVAFAAFRRVANAEPIPPASPNATGQIDESMLQEIQPGTIATLPLGEDITFSDPPQVGDFKDFIDQVLHAIAAALGIPYELLTGVFPANFSASKLAFLNFYGFVDQEQETTLEPLVLDRIFEWFEEAARDAGFEGFGEERPVPVWIAPARPMVDAVRESKAAVDDIRAGLSTWQRECRRRGINPREQIRQLKQQNKLFDDAKLVLDCDARMFARIASAPLPPAEETATASAAASK